MENTKGEVSVTGEEGGEGGHCSLSGSGIAWLASKSVSTQHRAAQKKRTMGNTQKNAQWALHDQLHQH